MLSLAVLNGKAQLACDIQPPSADDSIALVLWYKDDSLAPIYTVDARKVSSLDKAKISFDDQYSNRINFRLKMRPALLQLDNLRQEDEGDYRCRVDFKRGRTVNTIIQLRVVIPPTESAIFAPNNLGNKLSGLIGPFNEGDPLDLVCQAQGGKPRPQLTWRRDFNVINSTHQSVDKEGTSVALRIPSLSKSHLLSIFTCEASNNNITSPLQSSITLDLNLKPREVSLRQVNAQEALLAGQTATFECSTQGSRPQATIHWLFQGTRHEAPMNVDQQQTSSTLSLTLQRSFNQQPLICVAENPRISQGSAVRQAIKLDVHYAPLLNIRLEPQQTPLQQATGTSGVVAPEVGSTWQTTPIKAHLSPSDNNSDDSESVMQNNTTSSGSSSSSVMQLQEGNDIYLTCQMDANPRPIKPILWRFNGRPVHNNQNQYFQPFANNNQQQQQQFIMSNHSLVLRKVVRQQSGIYTCEATNQHGSGTSKPLELIIKHAPVCQTNDVLVYETAIGQSVYLDCQVQANPAKSVQFNWYRMRPKLDAIQMAHDSLASNESFNTKQIVGNHMQKVITSINDDHNNNNNARSQLKLNNDEDDDDENDAEQIVDAKSARLKFNIETEADQFAVIKCKAKNEIGLQQKPCSFQLIPSRGPILRHTCALIADNKHQDDVFSPSSHLQVNCKPSEHLKTHQSDLMTTSSRSQGQTGHSDAWHKWPLGLDSGRRQSGTGTVNNQSRRRWRLLYPPNWLLGEFYKAQRQISANNSDQAAMTPSDPDVSESSSVNYELIAYIIVGPDGQLARIKSIVEENQLFKHMQPRDIYYVAAKQTPSRSNQKVDVNDKTRQGKFMDDTFDQHDSTDATATAADVIIASNDDDWAKRYSKMHIEDSIQLADEFNFTIPSLEPETKYKLLIYGQNLTGNKTADWLIVRGETSKDTGDSTTSQGRKIPTTKQQHRQQMDAPSNLMINDTKRTVSTGRSMIHSNHSQQQQQQKSIVMRSELDDLSGNLSHDNLTKDINDEDTSIMRQTSGNLTFARSLASMREPLTVYKEYAIYYAKQKPLLAIPVALGSCLMLLLAIIWLSGLFVGLVRRRSWSSSWASSQNHTNTSSDLSNSSSLDTNKSSPDDSSSLINATNTAPINGFHSLHKHHNHSHQQQASPDSSEHEKLMNKAAMLQLQHNGVQFISTESTNDGSFESNVTSTVMHNRNKVNMPQIACNLKLLDANEHHHQQQRARTVYSVAHADQCDRHQIQDSELLDAIALERLYSQKTCTNNNNNNHHHQVTLSTQNTVDYTNEFGLSTCPAHLDHNRTRFVGSLDRRFNLMHQQQHEPSMYLADDDNDDLQHRRQPLSFIDFQAPAKQHKFNSMDRHLQQHDNCFRPSSATIGTDNESAGKLAGQRLDRQSNAASSITGRVASSMARKGGRRNKMSSGGQSTTTTTGRRSHVAFDLSSTNTNDNNDLENDEDDELHHCRNQQVQKLGSDSGTATTTTGNTDSGHESPATGELTSFTSQQQLIINSAHHQHSNGGKQQQQQLMLSPGSFIVGTSSSNSNELAMLTNNSNGGGDNSCCCQNQTETNECHGSMTGMVASNGSNHKHPNMFMLLELSPGSQESSTLLQSVDSLGDLAPLTSTILHSGQQMATSFATTMSTAHQNNQHSKL